MFKLDDNFLHQLGLGGLPVDEKNRMLAHIYETLEMRVGMRLAEQMSNEQLDEFEGFIDTNDEAGALKWLESNFPHYKQVVGEELEKLKEEVRQSAPQILAAAQGAQAQPGMATGQPPTAPPPQPMQPPAQPYAQPYADPGMYSQQPYQQAPVPPQAPPPQPYQMPPAQPQQDQGQYPYQQPPQQ